MVTRFEISVKFDRRNSRKVPSHSLSSYPKEDTMTRQTHPPTQATETTMKKNAAHDEGNTPVHTEHPEGHQATTASTANTG